MNSKDNPTINNAPAILVIFGITGDLAEKKIIPSLWHLFQKGRLPERLSIIGFSRRNLSKTELREIILEAVKKKGSSKIEMESFASYFMNFSYISGKFEDEKSYRLLKENLDKLERSWGVCANKLFYFAVPPSNYEAIVKNLAAVKLNLPCGGKLGWSRVLIEKPFGTDLSTARKLQSLLSSHFKDEQIYRIDHYLFKEIIQGIENFRFSNNLFENIWDNTTIERIDILLHESIGVETRGNFYDSIGALRDVGQNHLLSILSMLTMEYPLGIGIDATEKRRTKILESLSPWTKESLQNNTLRAQYKGYKAIEGVGKDSKTETYFAIKTELNHPRWKNIPIVISAGKRMSEARKEIILTLKHSKNCYLCEIGEHGPNRIIFRLEPKDEIIINFWTKKPGLEQILEERSFSFFLYQRENKVQYVEEYAKIIHAAIEGDQSLFISNDEVESEWKFTDPIIKGWRQNIVPLEEYTPGITPTPEFIQTASGKTYTKVRSDAAEIGIIGLGKMGGNISRQLFSKGWNVTGFNRSPDTTKELVSEGINDAYSLKELVAKSSIPRTIWLMVPHQTVDKILEELVPLLEKGDTVIDGGNSPFKDSIQRAKTLKDKGINFLDVGVSGGPEGARYGASLMVGGDIELFKKYEHLFKDLSVKDGYGYMGKSGAGHFVKMVHNGIEYGMMQAIGEGFEIMKKYPFMLNLHSVAEVYNHGSVITSRLVGWLSEAYAKFGDELNADECCSGEISQSGEGQWTVETAKELGVPVSIIEGSLEFRKKSESNPSYTGQVVSALRHEFGGHDTRKKHAQRKLI